MPPEVSQARLVSCVALGGAFGGLVRWLLTAALPDHATVPWTTWTVNVTGAAALAALPLLLASVARDQRRRQLLAALLGPGFLGGYTTLSAYALLARDRLAEGAVTSTAVLLLSTLAVSLLAVHAVRRWELRRPPHRVPSTAPAPRR